MSRPGSTPKKQSAVLPKNLSPEARKYAGYLTRQGWDNKKISEVLGKNE
jgi:hypothetical protein